jgi:hypothetical protein
MVARLKGEAAEARRESRGLRARSAAWWREQTKLKGVRGCGLAVSAFVNVGVTADGIAHAKGIARCGSPWVCQSCAPVVREGRARDIDMAAAAALALGLRVWFVTLTAPHGWGDTLGRSFDVVRTARGRSRSGRQWRRLCDAHGFPMVGRGGKLRNSIPAIRAWEVTVGANGWHPHCHELLFTSAAGDAGEQAAAIRAHFVMTYGKIVRDETGRDLHPVHGIDVQAVHNAGDVAKYLTKVSGGWGAGLEIARGDVKKARGGLSAMDVMHAAEAGERVLADKRRPYGVPALDLAREYESGTAGRRCIVWSPGLRGLLLPEVGDELSDEELAAAEADAPFVWDVLIPAAVWRVWRNAGHLGTLLDLAEGCSGSDLSAVLFLRWVDDGPPEL